MRFRAPSIPGFHTFLAPYGRVRAGEVVEATVDNSESLLQLGFELQPESGPELEAEPAPSSELEAEESDDTAEPDDLPRSAVAPVDKGTQPVGGKKGRRARARAAVQAPQLAPSSAVPVSELKPSTEPPESPSEPALESAS